VKGSAIRKPATTGEKQRKWALCRPAVAGQLLLREL
jgi:hypothetical protein